MTTGLVTLGSSFNEPEKTFRFERYLPNLFFSLLFTHNVISILHPFHENAGNVGEPTPPALRFRSTGKSGDKENYKVFVGVVEISRVEFIPVIVKFGFGVVVGSYTAVKVCNTEGVPIKHNADNTGRFNR